MSLHANLKRLGQFFQGKRTGCDQRAKSARRRVPRFRPRIELLEERRLLATWLVTDPGDNGNQYTLRWAISQANTDSDPFPEIAFQFAPGQSSTIQLSPALGPLDPIRHRDVTIDGGPATLDGTQLYGTQFGSADGLVIQASGCRVMGLTILGFYGGSGIVLSADSTEIDVPAIRNNGTGVLLDGGGAAFNGVRADEIAANGTGVLVRGGATNNTIHDSTISGNYVGVEITGQGTSQNKVKRNQIGPPTFDDSSGNSTGVLIDGGATDNIVGEPQPPAGFSNVIADNTDGVQITGVSTGANIVEGNVIGADPSYTAATPNIFGVDLTGGTGGNTIGGKDDGEGSIGKGNDIWGNYYGVWVEGGAHDNTVGALVSGSDKLMEGGNRIGANGFYGVGISDTGTTGNKVEGNEIGTGTADGANGNGVWIQQGASNNIIGGTDTGAGNIILGNGSGGIVIEGTGTAGNGIQGNAIGGNRTGVNIKDGASNNTIGGSPTARNIIAFNQHDGVDVVDNTSVGNAILVNQISDNGALGIDLGGDGPTANTLGGPHTGPNNLQNYPVLTYQSQDSVNFSLNSTPNSMFRIDFYANKSPGPSGHGEGRDWLNSVMVTTDGIGNYPSSGSDTFTYTHIAGEPDITATATLMVRDPSTGAWVPTDTSEFCPDLRLPHMGLSKRTVQVDLSGVKSFRMARDPLFPQFLNLGFDKDTVSIDPSVFDQVDVTAAANNTIDIEDVPAGLPVTITGGTGNEVVNISPSAQNLGHIQSPVTVHAGTSSLTLNIYDRGDPLANAYTLTDSGLSDQQSAGISYDGVRAVNLVGSALPDTYNILNTASSASTALYSNNGGDVVNVEATTGPLTVNLPAAGNPTVNVSPKAQNLDAIQGSMTVAGQGVGTLFLGDQAAPVADSYILTASSLSRPKFGGLTYSGISNLTVNAAPNGDPNNPQPIYVLGTPAGMATTINAANGWHDIFAGLPDGNPLGIPGTPLDGILGPVTVSGQAYEDTLDLYDSASSAAKTYALNATGIAVSAVNGAAVAKPVPISWQGPLGVAVLFGSSAADTYQLQSLPAGLADLVVYGAPRANTFQSLVPDPHTWLVYPNTGVTTTAAPGQYVIFQGVYNFTGGPGGDDFQLTPNNGRDGGLSGVLDGNGGTLDYSQDQSPITVDLANHSASNLNGGAAGGFANIQHVLGNNSSTTLVGPDIANSWNITGPNQGTLADALYPAGPLTFSQVPNLTGGATTDDFVFGPAGSLSGFLSGGDGAGGGSNNTLDLSAYTSPLTVHVGTYVYGGTVPGVVHAFTLCQNVIGGQGDDRFLFDQGFGLTNVDGGPGNNTLDFSPYYLTPPGWGFAILGHNSGLVAGVIGAFRNIQNLVGTQTDDKFAFRGAASLDGTIDGQGGSNAIDYTQSAASVTVNLQTGTASYVNLQGGSAPQPGGIANIQTFVGGPGSANTLIAADTPNAWSITEPDSGSVNASGFKGFQDLTGGAAADTFAFLPGGSVSGSLDGGGGVNALDYSQYSGDVTVDLALHLASLVHQGAAGSVFNIANVTGSMRNNLLVGDANANMLIGGTGRNLLIGGAGGDMLDASRATSDNILIGGWTDYDSSLAALLVLMAEWTRTDLGFRDRFSDLLTGSNSLGVPPLNVLNGQLILLTPATNPKSSNGTVHADTSPDTLIGTSQTDPATGKRAHNAFFYDADDVLVNFLASSDQKRKVT
jgi:hypothetical protein